MRNKTCFDSGVPNASCSQVLRYLEKIFKTKLPKNCGDFESAVTYLNMLDTAYIPEGLNRSCAVMYERFNVISSVWNLNKKSALAGVAYEMGDQSYMLVVDSNLHGADALFLITTSICVTAGQRREDLKSVVDSWSSHGIPKILTGGFQEDDGTTLQLIAAQLITLVDKQ